MDQSPEINLDDLKSMSEPELAYAVILQLAIASATVANVHRRRRRPYKPEEFLIQLRSKAKSLPDAMRAVMGWADRLKRTEINDV
jgi:hypothetical protein